MDKVLSTEFKNLYRPKTLANVVGQTGVKQFLKNAFDNNQVPQVLLFEGPKGTGKTTIARIVAMGLNCEKNKSMSPCGKCDSCVSILNNTSPDYQEINIGDKTGVNDMRALAEMFKFSPMYLDNKVFILDETHQLTKAAQNKLLKDLEDTPENVYIIFCTTETKTLLPTLLDRCYDFKFHYLSDIELLQILEYVLIMEQRTLSKNVRRILIELADGSARQLLVNLHKVLLLDNTEAEDVVMSVLGSRAEVTLKVPAITNAILNKNFAVVRKYVSKYNAKECNELAVSMVNYLGGRLLRKPSNDIIELIDTLEPTLAIINKGVFIKAVCSYILKGGN